jgi:hypothetical protein
MAVRCSLNQSAISVCSLGKAELKQRIRNFKGRFKLDFSEEYLDSLGVEKLRHILMAALMTSRGCDAG